jgi:predicted RNA-binding protein
MIELRTPAETLQAMQENPVIRSWHEYIRTKYEPPPAEIMLLYPCAMNKPWTEDKTSSRQYLALYKMLGTSKLRLYTSLHTIGEPLGIVGERDYERMPEYDNPGLFKTMVPKAQWSQEAFEECVEILGQLIGEFLERTHRRFEAIYGVCRPNSVHRKMLIRAAKETRARVEIVPKWRDMEILRYYNNPNRLYNQGLANSSIQRLVERYLTREILRLERIMQSASGTRAKEAHDIEVLHTRHR